MRIKKQTWKNCLVLLPFAIVVCLYELLPLLQMALNSFHDENTGAWSLSNYGKIFSTPLYQTSIINSIRISLISALVGICVAFLAAKSYHDAGKKFQRFFTMVLNMTSNFSGVPLTFGFMILLGNTGVLTLAAQKMGLMKEFNLYSGNGLTLIYIYFQIPLATLLLIPFLVPFIYSLSTEWVGIIPSGFTGKHYVELFQDAEFWLSVGRTLVICVVSVSISITLLLGVMFVVALYAPWLGKYIQFICMIPYALQVYLYVNMTKSSSRASAIVVLIFVVVFGITGAVLWLQNRTPGRNKRKKVAGK